MAKTPRSQGYKRWFNTRFWNDSFVADLDPTEKLLFIYFLTNEHCNIAGIYEVPVKIIALETGFEVSMVKKILKDLKDKVRYLEGRVVVKNWLKHQSFESADTKTGILNVLKHLDKAFLKKIVEKNLFFIPDEIREGASWMPTGSHTYSDTDSDTDSDSVVPEALPFDLKLEIDKMENDSRRHVQIIGLYFKQKKPDIRSKAQLNTSIARHSRAAKDLSTFDDDQILKSFRKASDWKEWTIETALKNLTK